MSRPSFDDLSTLAVRGGLTPDPTTGAIVTPIVQSTTYVQEAVGLDKGHTYTRASNPTVSALEASLGALEDAPPSVAFATGMAATHALCLTTLNAGDHAVVSRVVYGGTYRLLDQVLSRFGVTASFVDTTQPDEVTAAIRDNTRLLFIETPANPTLVLTDIRTAAGIAKRAGILLAVDNTFLTPVAQRPLDLGADLSLYSTTKYIEGHNAAVGGAITSRNADLLEKIRFVRKTVGSIQSPFDSWVTLRGIKTLPLRLKQHSENALIVAKWLEQHPLVESVSYPGLDNFPQAALARKQHLLHAGLIAFEVRGGEEAGRTVMNSVRLCSLAESLGAVETLITHPATMTHGSIPPQQRQAIGITDGLIRLSVGLESPADIIADLEQALARAANASLSPPSSAGRGGRVREAGEGHSTTDLPNACTTGGAR